MNFIFSVNFNGTVEGVEIEAETFEEATAKLSNYLTGRLTVNLESFSGNLTVKRSVDIYRPQVSKIIIGNNSKNIPGLLEVLMRETNTNEYG